MDLRTILFVLLGTLCMLIPIMLSKKTYDLTYLKCVLLTLVITVLGVPSVKLMYFLENGNFGGLSFFGGVLFVPILIFPFSFLLRIPYKNALDVLAPSMAIMSAVMKINCQIEGCCYGKVLFYDGIGNPHRFPSQMAEMAASLLICAFLVLLIVKGKSRGLIYPIYFVTYGTVRFILNLFRYASDAFLGLPIGNLWSILCVILGGVWIGIKLIYQKKKA